MACELTRGASARDRAALTNQRTDEDGSFPRSFPRNLPPVPTQQRLRSAREEATQRRKDQDEEEEEEEFVGSCDEGCRAALVPAGSHVKASRL